MADGFSWAPFGPTPREDDEPLPPLPDADADADAAPPPPPVEVDFEVEPLPFEATTAPPPPPPARPWAPPPDEPPPGTAEVAPASRERPGLRGGGDAAAALVWGILGVTILPVLLPSIAAIRVGRRARQAGGGLGPGRHDGLARAGIVLGWIGVLIWVVAILVLVATASSPEPDIAFD